MSANNRGYHLTVLRKELSEKNLKSMQQALRRFETGKLQNLPKGSKLTRLNLSIEAGVSRDTPFSKYRAMSEKVGQYRYPEIIDHFNLLRAAKNKIKDKDKEAKEKLKEKTVQVQELENLLSMSRNVVNAQDVLIDKLRKDFLTLQEDLELTIKNYDEEIAKLSAELVKLKRNNIKVFKPK